MTDEEIDRYFAALDQAVKPLGCAGFDEAVRAFFPWLIRQTEQLSKLQDREAARRFLRDLPSAESAVFRQLLSGLPQLVFKMRREAPDLVKQIPHAPGGAPQLFNAEQRAQICAEIDRMYSEDGMRLEFIHKCLAKQYGASVRTIQRISKERQKN
jgi:hypothetical protein